ASDEIIRQYTTFGVLSLEKTSIYIFCEILHNALILLNYNWMLRVCIVDFELTIIYSLKYQFTEITIIGSNFCHRQNLLIKMQKPRIPASEYDSCMQFIGILSSPILGGKQVKIWKDIIVTLRNRFRMSIKTFFSLFMGFKRMNLI
ncbi:hypothetical protein MXB_4199, partial [Myxobolus squamalis]